MRYFIELSYFGKNYHGWQKQPNAITVQETIEKAFATLLRVPIAIMGAGRTDTGVHALQMFAHFDWEDPAFAKAKNRNTLVYKLNSLLPPDIAVYRIIPVKYEAHTRFNATHRSYVYRIAKKKNPFTTNHAHTLRRDVDISLMNEAAAILLQYRDFQSFSKSNTEVHTYNCTITEAAWHIKNDELQFNITANRFLRNMVRAIVGTLLEIGEGKKPVSWMHDVITQKDRCKAGASVPGHGLYLSKIIYPDTIYI